MSRTVTLIFLLIYVNISGVANITLDYCLQRAEENYPVIKKYGLLETYSELNLSDINRGWLPRIGFTVQGNVQNIVPAFPTALTDILSHTGFNIKDMSKLQYKIAAELNQTVWDGGASKSNREIERASSAESKAAIDVELYAVRSQVENLFFGILLIQEQLKQTESTLNLLSANLQRLQSMVKNGTAMQSDADMVEAQYLTLKQNIAEATSAIIGYKTVLAIYIGEEIHNKEFICPDASIPESMESARPELNLFERRIELNQAREKAIQASLMPRIGFFTQTYYGYPGYNYFESMINRNLSFNILAGIRVSWNIEPLYTKNINRKKLLLSSEMINADRDIFLFNSQLQSSRENSKINGLREVIKEDGRIVELRRNVRLSAESQLKNGIIDATALLSKINDENQANLNSAYHQIQLIQNIYKLKNTLNR